jgi:hypothetical protein
MCWSGGVDRAGSVSAGVVDYRIIALIGIILLIGIVKKNAIMMTTSAALLGALPLALGTGAGAELRRTLRIAIVGGLIVSQALMLFYDTRDLSGSRQFADSVQQKNSEQVSRRDSCARPIRRRLNFSVGQDPDLRRAPTPAGAD